MDNGHTNRIGGDFNLEAVEAFRAAYAQTLNTPDEDTVANDSGLPTNVVANTSPWHESVGLWKYPSGKGYENDLKVSDFDPNDYLNKVVDAADADEIEDLSEEETDEIIEEIKSELEESPEG